MSVVRVTITVREDDGSVSSAIITTDGIESGGLTEDADRIVRCIPTLPLAE